MVHVLSGTEINNFLVFFFVQGIARLAVPFFFCCTGYFLAGKGIENGKVVLGFNKKILKLYAMLSLIYIPLELVKMTFLGTFHKAGLLGYFQSILVRGTFVHLWYFPAIIIATFSLHFLITRIPISMVIIIATCLYLIGLLGDGYYGILHYLPQWIYQSMAVYQDVFLTTRNGIFFGLPFVLMGVMIAKSSGIPATSKAFPWFLATLLFGGFEIYILSHYELAVDYNLTLFLVPGTVLLFLLLLAMPDKLKIHNDYVRLYSTKLYESHMLFYGIILALVTLYEIPLLENVGIQLLMVWAVSHMFACFAVKRITRKKRMKNAMERLEGRSYFMHQ